MPKVFFAKRVKHNGVTYKANEVFEVTAKELDLLKAAGAWEVDTQQEEPVVEVEEDVVAEEPVEENDDEQVKDQEPTVEELREKAIQLGIPVKGNWGIPKLTEVIAEAEAE